MLVIVGVDVIVADHVSVVAASVDVIVGPSVIIFVVGDDVVAAAVVGVAVVAVAVVGVTVVAVAVVGVRVVGVAVVVVVVVCCVIGAFVDAQLSDAGVSIYTYYTHHTSSYVHCTCTACRSHIMYMIRCVVRVTVCCMFAVR